MTTTICLLSARSIPTIALRHRHQLTQPSQPRVAVAVTPGHTTTVTHERPPPAMGHQARSASGGRSYVRHRHAERLSMPMCGCIKIISAAHDPDGLRDVDRVAFEFHVAYGPLQASPSHFGQLSEPGSHR